MASKSAKKAGKKVAKKAGVKKVAAKKAPAKKAVAKKAPAKKTAAKKAVAKQAVAKKIPVVVDFVDPTPKPLRKVKMTPFIKAQKQRLLDLRDELVEAMEGVARDSLRVAAESGESAAFGMHSADAGSDSYDRDFALNLLGKEHDGLYEIDAALKRIEDLTYSVCELCQKDIPKARLEAIPFARMTVECQTLLERHEAEGGNRHTLREKLGVDGPL